MAEVASYVRTLTTAEQSVVAGVLTMFSGKCVSVASLSTFDKATIVKAFNHYENHLLVRNYDDDVALGLRRRLPYECKHSRDEGARDYAQRNLFGTAGGDF